MHKIKVSVIICLIFFFGCIAKDKKEAPKGMVIIPEGEFIMGADKASIMFPVMSDKLEGRDNRPSHKVFLDAFYIDMYEVTYKKYAKFKKSLAKFIYGRENYPVTGQTWFEADNFCKWSKKRLPTETEWEKAARGKKGYIYSWGNDFNAELANLGTELKLIGSFQEDKSGYGVYDMVGNVSEWTSSWYEPYPLTKYKNEMYGKKLKVARGGSFNKDQNHNYSQIFAQVIFRHSNPPNTGALDTGFRCVSQP